MASSLMLNSFSITQTINFAPILISDLKSRNHVAMVRKRSKLGCYSKPSTSNIKDVKMEKHQIIRCDGIGILRFLRGKHLLITGATGFLAKVLVEKILREVPDVGKIYLLMKATSEEGALQRLENEIINADLFKLLQDTYGDSYSAFMRSKLIPVIGNISDSNLGLEENLARQIADKIDIIVNSAANTTFDERYDVALKINTNGPCNIISFAKRCNQLRLFLHVSTAYTNGKREGKIMEKAFQMGDCIATENQQLSDPLVLDVQSELHHFAFHHFNDSRKMKQLGMARANMFGWLDTYGFTKAMGEMVIDEVKGDIPVVIVRPTIIESTLNDPFPGWIQGYRVADPFIMIYGSGNLPSFPADDDVALDLIPVDMVVNTILAAIATHGSEHKSGDNDTNVYHVGSSEANPILLRKFTDMLYEYFSSYPYTDPFTASPVEVLPMKLYKTMDDFSSNHRQDVVRQLSNSSMTTDGSEPTENLSTRLEKIVKRSMNRVEQLASIYSSYTFYNGRFDISNTEKLMECMSEEEKMKFSIDIRGINWKHYISHIHIPGLKRHVLKLPNV